MASHSDTLSYLFVKLITRLLVILENHGHSKCQCVNRVNVVSVVVWALRWISSLLVLGEEHSVASRRVGIVMTSRCCHEGHICLQEIFKLEAVALLGHRPRQKSCQRALKCILTRLETVMVVVVASFLPELFLAVTDDITNDGSFVGAATPTTSIAQVHDRPLIVLLGFLVFSDFAEVLLKLTNVVVPVH